MKVKRLKELLVHANPNDEVLVAINDYKGGTMNLISHGAAVADVYIGFDWDSGKTYIQTKSPLKYDTDEKAKGL